MSISARVEAQTNVVSDFAHQNPVLYYGVQLTYLVLGPIFAVGRALKAIYELARLPSSKDAALLETILRGEKPSGKFENAKFNTSFEEIKKVYDYKSLSDAKDFWKGQLGRSFVELIPILGSGGMILRDFTYVSSPTKVDSWGKAVENVPNPFFGKSSYPNNMLDSNRCYEASTWRKTMNEFLVEAKQVEKALPTATTTTNVENPFEKK